MTTHGTDEDPGRTRQLDTRAPVTAAAGDGELAPGARLGRYRIEALLGRGGMGEVYRAEQLEPVQRTVALKLLRSKRLTARHLVYFDVERQLLAQMRHPAIAQIYDAGTTDDGVPYFVMEYIEGSPLVRFCAERGLALRQRIELFVRICEGVQHAHQKGVIHRDLKPGNLLVDEVDGRPLPKIIDFGIAIAASLDDATGARDVAGTPEYMSPEQAAGGQAQVDTRSDVYSLGVVLYELLTGRRPVAGGETATGNARTLRLPSEQLSTLPPEAAGHIARAQGLSLPHMRRMLRRELDWVVLKAMHHDRADRYDSAAALADDLRRFLDGRPLLAVPPRRGYVWGKFVRRHRGALLAASLALAALLGGLGMSLYGLSQARAQRAIAERRSAELEKVAAFQQSMLQGVDIERMGIGLAEGLRGQVAKASPDAVSALEQALAHASTADIARTLIDRNILAGAEAAISRDFAREPGLAADLRESVARMREALGLHEAAAAGFRQVAEYRAQVLGPGARSTLQARQEQANALIRAAHPEQARQILEAALGNAAALGPVDEVRSLLELSLSEAIGGQGDLPRAMRMQQSLYERLAAGLGDTDPITLRVLNNLGISHARTRDFQAARKLFEKLFVLREKTLGFENADTLKSAGNLAAVYADTGAPDKAAALNQRLYEVNARRLGSEHPETLSNRSNLGADLMDLGRYDEALPQIQGVVEARTRVLGPDHPQTLRSRWYLASLHARMKAYDTALPLAREVIEARKRVLGAEHPDTLLVTIRYADILRTAGRASEALAVLGSVLPAAREVLGVEDGQVRGAIWSYAELESQRGNLAPAIAAYEEILTTTAKLQGLTDVQTVEIAWQLSKDLSRAGRAEEAARLYQRYIAPLLAEDISKLNPEQAELARSIAVDQG